MEKLININGELNRDKAFKIANEFGVKITKSNFNREISKLSTIVSVTYHKNQICFKSYYGFIVLRKNESKSIFGSLLHQN